MYVNAENYDDVNKYYKGTWIKVDKQGDTLFYVESASPSAIFLHSISKEGCIIDLTKETDSYHLSFLLPHKAVFQYNEQAIILVRHPARMWKKGICASNTMFFVLKGKKWENVSFDTSLLEGFVNKPTYLSLSQARALFETSLISAALSPRISLSKEGGLYIDSILVGKFSFLKNALSIKQIYYPEVKHIFSGTTFLLV